MNFIPILGARSHINDLFFTQVTQSVYNLLSKRGFTFECRGLVAVKGKGKMVTYWLLKGQEGT